MQQQIALSDSYITRLHFTQSNLFYR